jgi:hypothetical protein
MKITLTMHLHYVKYDWEEKGEYQLYSCELNDENRTHIGTREVEVDVPEDYDPRAQQIAFLQQRKKEVMADFQNTITEIDGKISNLQALEYTA